MSTDESSVVGRGSAGGSGGSNLKCIFHIQLELSWFHISNRQLSSLPVKEQVEPEQIDNRSSEREAVSGPDFGFLGMRLSPSE